MPVFARAAVHAGQTVSRPAGYAGSLLGPSLIGQFRLPENVASKREAASDGQDDEIDNRGSGQPEKGHDPTPSPCPVIHYN